MVQSHWLADNAGHSRTEGSYRLVVREISGMVRYMILLSPDGAGRTPSMMLQSGTADTVDAAMNMADRIVSRLAPSPPPSPAPSPAPIRPGIDPIAAAKALSATNQSQSAFAGN